MTDRDVMKMALSWIHYSRRTRGEDEPEVERALRSALAQPEPPKVPIVEVCCQQFADCLKPCTPRGAWLERQKPAPETQGSKSMPVLVSVIRAFLNGSPPSMARSDAQWALTELEADAARYRWLRERLHARFQKSIAGDSRLALDVRIGAAYFDATPSGPNSYLNPQTFWDECANLDAAIDAARDK